jgi:hypothetical protein
VRYNWGMPLSREDEASIAMLERLYRDPKVSRIRMPKRSNAVFYARGDHRLTRYSDKWMERYLQNNHPVTKVFETGDPRNPWIFLPEASHRN